MDQGESIVLIDVREESEFAAGHIPGAIHVSKGVIERDIEKVVPDFNKEILLTVEAGFDPRCPPTTFRRWASRTW